MLRSVLVAFVSAAIFSVAVAFQNPGTPPTSPAPIPVPDTPRYYKGNLHTHSLWSDGDDYPEMIADWYKQRGYDFLALTEHNILAEGEKWIEPAKKATGKVALEKYRQRFGNNWVETRIREGKSEVRLKPQAEYRSLLEEAGRFLLVPAEEITHRYAKAPVHINAINIRDAITPLDGGNVGETIAVNLRTVAETRERSQRKMLAILNHPNFRWGVRGEDMLFAEELRYFEVFNGHPGVANYGDATHASCERLWDVVLAIRIGKYKLPILYGLASDDAHNYYAWGVGKANPGRGWIMVRAPHLTAEAIVDGLEAGDFYSSSGVTLQDVRVEKGELKLNIQGEPGVTYRTEFIATPKSAKFDSEPRRDANGKELPVTRVYSEEIGQVVGQSTSRTPSCKLNKDWLYVRARVISSKPHPNPFQTGDTEMAWTQPVQP
ncbi:MAG: hypothetical protein LC104_12230 [Bacteroidales bacterium]|nr:hypothetical protein [Bacteroidales bacterium]